MIGERVIEIGQSVEVLDGERFVRQGPEMLGGLQFGGVRG